MHAAVQGAEAAVDRGTLKLQELFAKQECVLRV